jgi:hypothetical protein
MSVRKRTWKNAKGETKDAGKTMGRTRASCPTPIVRSNFRPNWTKQAITGRHGCLAGRCRSAVFTGTSATRRNWSG